MSVEHNSREIVSNQQEEHKNLEAIVRKHFETLFKKPIAQHTQAAFDELMTKIGTVLTKDTPLLFDSFCGTGRSTRIIAERNPDAIVVGIDRSISRLSKTSGFTLPDNMFLVQAECADFWYLAVRAGWQLKQHSIYYPNPYPKAKHIKRRWHAHPAYPLLFQLGGEVELRTNWKVYADEFSQSFDYAKDYLSETQLTCSGVKTLALDSNIEFMTLFEKKYFYAGQELYCCKYGL